MDILRPSLLLLLVLVAFVFAFVFPWFVWFRPSNSRGLLVLYLGLHGHRHMIIKICDGNRMGDAAALVFLTIRIIRIIRIILFELRPVLRPER